MGGAAVRLRRQPDYYPSPSKSSSSSAPPPPPLEAQTHLTTVEAFQVSDAVTVQNLQRRRTSLRQRFITDSTGSLQDCFEVERRPCGRGGFSSVFQATCKFTGQARAVKKIFKSRIVDQSALFQEIEVCKVMDHPNVVKLYGTFQDADSIYMVMEFCEGGELFDKISEAKRLEEKDVATVMEQVLRAMCYVHGKDIVHRDLKPENFLLKSKKPLKITQLKLIDFGLSKHLEEGAVLHELEGSAFYAAPEVGNKEGYGKASDLWSCGVMMYLMLCGSPPFSGRTDKEVRDKARTTEVRMSGPIWEEVSHGAKETIRRLLSLDPQRRSSAEQVLESDWMRSFVPMGRQISGNRPGTAEVEGSRQLAPELATNIRSYSKASSLKKAALIAIAQQLPQDIESGLRETFLLMDKDGTGTLPLDEVSRGISAAGVSQADLEQLKSQMDVNRDGQMSYTEFLAACMDQKKLQESDDLCWRAFKAFDLDNDGAIKLSEVRRILGTNEDDTDATGEPVSPLFKAMNRTGDGRVTFQEFKAMIKNDAKVSEHRGIRLLAAPKFFRRGNRSDNA